MGTVAKNRGEGKEIFCAIDLHDKTMLAGIAIDKGEVEYHQLDTDAEGGMLELIELLGELRAQHPGSRVHSSYEASGSGFGLADVLEDHGFSCEVLAPSRLPVSRKSRSEKTDRKDVVRIMNVMRSHVLAGSELPAVWKPDRQLRDDREIVRRRLGLGDELTRVKNQIHGLLKRNGLRKPVGMKNWTRAHLRWLGDRTAEAGRGLGATLSSLVRELEFYVGEEALVDAAVLELSRSERYCSRVQALTRLKGVGVLGAMVFLTELGDLDRFRNRKALGNYLGLTPRSYESGEGDDRKGHISRLGPWRLRKILNQCAWAVVRWDDYWGDWFRRRTEIAGLSAKKQKELRKKMITAVMRRLGIWMWHAGVEAGLGYEVAA